MERICQITTKHKNVFHTLKNKEFIIQTSKFTARNDQNWKYDVAHYLLK